MLYHHQHHFRPAWYVYCLHSMMPLIKKKKKKSLVNVNIGVVLCSHCRQKNRLYKELWRCLWLIQGRQLRQHLGEYVFLRMQKLFTPLEATHVCAGVNGGVFFSLTFSLKVLLLRKSLRATMKGKANGEN